MELLKKLRQGLLILAVLLAGGMAGCAGIAPVPGGDDEENKAFYRSEEEMKLRVSQLKPGMNKSLVFALLGREQKDFKTLDRPAIMTALYGGASAVDGSLEEKERARHFLQSLEGLQMTYRYVDSDLGFSSPIRVKTQRAGYDYTLTLVFQNGVLFDQPILSGGAVDDSKSKTFFDYLTPGLILKQ